MQHAVGTLGLAVAGFVLAGCTAVGRGPAAGDAMRPADTAPADLAMDRTSVDRTAADTVEWKPLPDATADRAADTVPDTLPDTPLPDTHADSAPDTVDLGPELPWGVGPLCFPNVYDPAEPGPDYDPFGPVVGTHCFGTNHQDIQTVQKVVFFGDSVTVGTPNSVHLLSVDNAHFYRNLLAEWLAGQFGLDTGDFLGWGLWKTYDYFSGKGGKLESGDFRNCSKWGARTDDFLAGGGQIAECVPDGGSPYRTLFLFTMGGNDIAKITQVGADATAEEVAAGYPAAWALAQSTVAYLEDAVVWLTDDDRFPNGSYVVFTNGFEFTDSTGETSACTPQLVFDTPGLGEIDLSTLGIPVASLAGYGEWADPAAQAEIVIWILEQYLRIAVDHQVDLIWTLESFCGHGYKAAGSNADPENRCYLGPDAPLWFDETCIHPSEAGHQALFQMFQAVVLE